MPRRETRHEIERALAEHLRKRTARQAHKLAQVEAHLAHMRAAMAPEQFARAYGQFVKAANRIGFQIRNNRRRDDGSMPALVEPPRGPRPLSGGAAAPLEFDA